MHEPRIRKFECTLVDERWVPVRFPAIAAFFDELIDNRLFYTSLISESIALVVKLLARDVDTAVLTPETVGSVGV